MKITRDTKIAPPRTDTELLQLCDYSTDEEVSVPISMEDIDRLNIKNWKWDTKTHTAWVQVKVLRQALPI